MKQLLLFLLISLIGHSQNGVPAKLARYMQAQADTNGFSGTVVVAKRGKLLLEKAYGLADAELNVKNTADTKFVLASVSKQFTAAGILRLAEQGKLQLTDRLSRFFPGFPRGDSISIHMMLSHSSGLNGDFDELYLRQAFLNKDSVLAYIGRKPLLFAPGSDVAYSNIAYYLLARVIEKASGQDFATYMHEQVFERAGMQHSGIMSNTALIKNRAKIYTVSEGVYAHNPYINWDYNIGHDGVYSTVGDLSLWDQALYGSRLLSDSSKAVMFRSYNSQGFGYGFMINPVYSQGHELIGHDGGYFGVMTSLNRYVKDTLFIAVLSNNESPSYMIAYSLAAIVFGKDVDLPYRHRRAGADTSLYSAFAGRYNKIEIVADHGKLFYNDVELVPESRTKFFKADKPDRTITFLLDKTGRARAIETSKGGVKERIERSAD